MGCMGIDKWQMPTMMINIKMLSYQYKNPIVEIRQLQDCLISSIFYSDFMWVYTEVVHWLNIHELAMDSFKIFTPSGETVSLQYFR